MYLGTPYGIGGGRNRDFIHAPKPVYTDFRSNQGADTSPLSQGIDRLYIAACGNATGTPPTMAAPWTLWQANAHPSGSLAVALYYLRATVASGQSGTMTGETGMRAFWTFSNADIDQIQFSYATSSTTLDWTALSGMTANSLVGVYAYMNTAQTNTSNAFTSVLTDFTQQDTRNTSSASWVGDSGVNYLSTFDRGNVTLDTSATRVIAVSFSIKGWQR